MAISVKQDIQPVPPQNPATGHQANDIAAPALVEHPVPPLELQTVDTGFETDSPGLAFRTPNAGKRSSGSQRDVARSASQAPDNTDADPAAYNPQFIRPYSSKSIAAFKMLGLWALPIYFALATMLKLSVPPFTKLSWLLILSPLLVILTAAAALSLLAAGLTIYAWAWRRKHSGRIK